jgi:hypothetical protein
MTLPTSNLKLYDVSMALSEGNYNISMYNVFTSLSVNAEGLDPNYCPGATPAARLTNLRTTPYTLGKFRGYDHAAGGSLYAISVSASSLSNPCGAPATTMTVYCQSATLADAVSADHPIYSDTAGTTLANNGWYSDVTDQWYWLESGVWRDQTTCSSLTAVLASGPVGSVFEACALSGKAAYYYHNGSNQVPVAGDTVYIDQSGSNAAEPGYYKVDSLTDWYEIGRDGLVSQNGKCP